ncbi:unnamed protein product, partial [Anisakis simplex]|uniref:30S ribosomal protein S21 n=1 Tax=Anisakis simplex TaxID=6269 RepID=A0A0M3JEU7_ANISI
MHEKEEAVARLSLEKEHVQEKLSELQQTLMNVLTKKGILQSYDRERVRRKKRDVNGAIVRRANKLRSFSCKIWRMGVVVSWCSGYGVCLAHRSHSTVDEFSGDEETVVDGRAQVIPETPEGALGVDVTTTVTATVSESNSDGTIQDKPAESCSGADLQNIGQQGA